MRRARVLVVDDSATIRKLIGDAVKACPELDLAGVAVNGEAALERLDTAPDVVTLDIEMPVMDGLSALRAIRQRRPKLPVLMFSSQTERGAIATLDALAAGASDFVAKPVVEGPEEGRAFVDREVIPRLRALTRSVHEAPAEAKPPPPPRSAFAAAVTARPAPPPPAPRSTSRIEAVAIAISTGGPLALAQLVPALPADLPVPILIVQHMPPLFTRILADRLSGLSALKVREAKDGDLLEAGQVYLAPGGHHLVVGRAGALPVLRLDEGPPENSCKPAADPLFRSAAEAWGAGLLAVVMTGMGRDGCAGAERIRARGGAVLAQDEASSVVWGMPGAVVAAGLAEEVVPLAGLATAITGRVLRGRTAHAAPGARVAP